MDQPTPLKLQPLDQPEAAAPVDIPAGGLTLGRDPSCELVVPAERFPHVSGRHARVVRERDAWLVEDLDSRNGTLLNGKRVERSRLRPGDVIQLGGEIGARFLVLGPEAVARTLELGDPPRGATTTLSTTGVDRLKRALGLPADPAALPRAAGRRLVLIGVLVFVPTLLLLAWGLLYLVRSQQEGLEELRGINRELEERIREATERFREQARDRAAERQALEDRHAALRRELEALEKKGDPSATELGRVRGELDETSARLARFTPLDPERFEADKRARFREILAATVYIEKKIVFREKDGRRYLHKMEAGSPRLREVTRPEEVHHADGKSGSGFCVSPRGWIVTNAHVVNLPELGRPIKIGSAEMEAELRLDVVFSGTALRHEAHVLRRAVGDDEDYAVLAVEPFEGMPVIGGFDLDAPLPEPGAPARLFGFPLGKELRQPRDAVVASVFAGIVSRRIDPYLQIQAVVYPGLSGGPAVDADGRVIGIVTGVQTVGRESRIASDIGFALPIGGLKRIWPPAD